MNEDFYSLWLKFTHSGESLSQFAKRVGVPKSTLSVAFRVIEQMERRYSYHLKELERKEEELKKCKKLLEVERSKGIFDKLLGILR